VGLALALAFTDWALGLQPGVTEASLERFRPGMRLGQVATILGGPPLLYSVSYHGPAWPEREECYARAGTWLADGGAVSVWFDRNGLVVASACYPSPLEGHVPLARLAPGWVGDRWGRNTGAIPSSPAGGA